MTFLTMYGDKEKFNNFRLEGYDKLLVGMGDHNRLATEGSRAQAVFIFEHPEGNRRIYAVMKFDAGEKTARGLHESVTNEEGIKKFVEMYQVTFPCPEAGNLDEVLKPEHWAKEWWA